MQTHIRAAAAAGLAALVLWPLSSAASTIIVGEGLGHDCSARAIRGQQDAETVAVCTRALEEETLSSQDYAKTLVNLGVVLLRRSSFDEAGRDFDEAEKMTPSLPEIYINRGVLMLRRRQFPEAVAQLDRGIALGSDEPEKAYFDRAIAKEGVGDLKGAYLDYRQAADLKPGWADPQKELTRFTVARAPS